MKIKLLLIVIGFCVSWGAPDLKAQIASQDQDLALRYVKPDKLDMQLVPLATTLQDLEERFAVNFFYKTRLVKGQWGVRYESLTGSLENRLADLLSPLGMTFNRLNRKTYTIVFAGNIKKAGIPTRQETVSGRVTDASTGETLPGVNVLVKGTSSGTATDIDGSFELVVPSLQDTLVFSFIGFQAQEVPIAGRTTLNIELQPQAIMGEEMVVVGYGMQEKKDLTGSISEVKGEKIQIAPTPDIANNLAGKLPGIIATQTSGQPGADQPSFFVRGQSTFGNNSALILVDGIERPFSRIDPNNIESITVLKDAASAAIYGARAANGVILVTTKSATKGELAIDYSGSIGFQKPTIKPDLMNAYQYAKYFNEARVNSGNVPFYTEKEVEGYRNGTLPSTDWWGETFKERAPIQQHSLSVGGGGKNTQYYFSLGMLNQGGLYELSSFDRYNLKANISSIIKDNLIVSVDVVGRVEERMEAPGQDRVFSGILVASKPTLPAFVPDAVAPGGYGFNGLNGNPIGQLEGSGYNNDSWNYLQSTIDLTYDIPWVEGFSANARFAFDRTFTHSKAFETPYTFYEYDNTTDSWASFTSQSKITLDEDRGEITQKTLQLSLNYERDFGRHNLKGLFLFEQSEDDNSSIYGYREGFLSRGIDQLFAGSDQNKDAGSLAGETARRGYAARVNYDYDGRYLAQANFRYDGSFNFREGRKWGLFPAFSVGWRISEEQFMSELDFLDNLKIRASWGQFGNDRVPPYQYMTAFQFSGGYIIGDTFKKSVVNTGIPNPAITWETATNTDVGLELGFLEGKIEAEVTYFYKRTEDILLPPTESVPATFGSSLPDQNIGIVDNKGIEASLTHNNTLGDLSFSVEGNVTYARSEIINMDEPEDVADRIRKTGRPLDQWFGYTALGLFQNQDEIDNWADQDGRGNASIRPGDIKYEDINNDGVINGFDEHAIGTTSTPEIVFGLNIMANYKGFDLSANIQGATNFNRLVQISPFRTDISGLTAGVIDAWRPVNTDAKYPRLTEGGPTVNNSKVSTLWLRDASYLRLKNVELAYNFFQSDFLQSLSIRNLRVSVSGTNLFTVSKTDFLDPEAPSGPSTTNQNLYYPQLKSYNIGMNIGF